MPRSITGTASGRHAALLVLAVTTAALVSGCSSGQIAQTANIVAAVPGASVDSPDGRISLRDLVVSYKAGGYAKGQSAPLAVRIFNNDNTKPLTLTAVTADKGKVLLVGAGPSSAPSTVPATPSRLAASPSSSVQAATSPTPTPARAAAGAERISVLIPTGGYVVLVPGSGEYLAVTGLTGQLLPGQSIKVTFAFDNGTTLTVAVPVGLPESPLPRSPVQLPSVEAEAH